MELRKLLILLLFGFCLPSVVYCQIDPPLIGGAHPVFIEDFAGAKTDILVRELGLNPKQKRKVYNIYLDQAKRAPGQIMISYKVAVRYTSHERPPTGISAQELRSITSREGYNSGVRSNETVHYGEMYAYPRETEKQVAERDKKMKKILTPEQYGKWVVIEKEMTEKEAERQPALLERMDNRLQSGR